MIAVVNAHKAVAWGAARVVPAPPRFRSRLRLATPPTRQPHHQQRLTATAATAPGADEVVGVEVEAHMAAAAAAPPYAGAATGSLSAATLEQQQQQQQSGPTTEADVVMAELAEFLREDLQHLFDDQGIDVSKYDEQVDFTDPITQYASLRGKEKRGSWWCASASHRCCVMHRQREQPP